MNDRAFALFLTWTTYGTWLPGDERAQDRARARQAGPTTWLSPERARIAAEAFVEAAVARQWKIQRGAVMANHVHLVLIDVPDDGPRVRRILKGFSQKRLTERANDNVSRRWWTQGGSDRYLHDDRSIVGAIRYVEEQKGMLVKIVENVVDRT